MKKVSFTLIELLVVVSIIGILVSLLLPGLSQAKNKARSVECKSNQSFMGVAVVMYTGDNDDTYPRVDTPFNDAEHFGSPYFDVGSGNNKSYSWMAIIAPYMGVPEEEITRISGKYGHHPLNQSPLFTNGGKWAADPGAINKTQYGEQEVYGYQNYRGNGYAFSVRNGSVVWRKVGKVDPSVIQVYDGIGDPGSLFPIRFPTNPGGSYIVLRHSGKTNALFVDGHVDSDDSYQTEYTEGSLPTKGTVWRSQNN